MSSKPHEARRVLRRLWYIPDMVAAAAMLAIVVVTVFDVAGRELHGLHRVSFIARLLGSDPWFTPLKGADELTVIFMAIFVYAVFATITWREGHIAVDLIDMVYPRRWIAPRQIALNLVAAIFMALVTWRVWIVAGRLVEEGEVTMFLRFPKGALTYFFALMCGAATLVLLANCVRYARGVGPLQVEHGAPPATHLAD